MRIQARIKRVLYKIIIGPIKYGSKDGYNAERYWHDRFLLHSKDLKSSGVEGFSEDENKKLYDESSNIFSNICNKEHIIL